MMNDNHRGRHHGNDRNKTPTDSEVDRLIHSESPRAQQIRLYQSLKEEIDKNSAGRIRYVDSELYFPNHRHGKSLAANRPSEVQTTTLDIGTAQSSRTQSKNFTNNNNKNNNNNNNVANSKGFIAGSSSSKRNSHDDVTMEDVDLNSSDGQVGHCRPLVDGNCQVCLIREVRDGLVNVTKIVQERNEQLSKLKARHLRSFFERQMLD